VVLASEKDALMWKTAGMTVIGCIFALRTPAKIDESVVLGNTLGDSR
jgi:hypothetical protein